MSTTNLAILKGLGELAARQRAAISEAQVREAIAYIERTDSEAEASYWAALVIEEGSDGRLDSIVKGALQRALQGPGYITMKTHGEVFVDALRRYVRILLKYQQWHAAFELLKLSASLSSWHPGWVSNYLAKLYFETEPALAFKDPEPVLAKLMEGASQPEYSAHSYNIFRDFLLHARASLTDDGELSAFVEKVRSFFRASPEALASVASADFGGYLVSGDHTTSTRPGAAPDSAAQLRDQIEALELRLAEAEALVSELTNRNLGLMDEIVKLRDAMVSEGGQTGPLGPAFLLERLRILVIGDIKIKHQELLGIAASKGLAKSNVSVVGYDGAKSYDMEKLRYNSAYDGVILGPVPHKAKGVGRHSSIVTLLRSEEGFPPFVEARVSGGLGSLKVSKTAFCNAITELLFKIGSIYPELATRPISG